MPIELDATNEQIITIIPSLACLMNSQVFERHVIFVLNWKSVAEAASVEARTILLFIKLRP